MFAYGKKKLVQSSNRVGIVACSTSSDSSLFAIVTRANLLVLFSSASLKLLALNADFDSNGDLASDIRSVPLFKIVDNSRLLYLNHEGVLNIYAIDKL